MLSSSYYTEVQNDATLLRKGGIILKGQTRNTRQPVHMMLLVDTSGSMEMEDKLSSVKRSIQLLLDLLSPDDRLSLVTFADDSKTFVNRASPSSEEREAILYRVNTLRADGSTNMSAGLLEARGLVEPPSSGRKQGLILLTDGHANLGVHSEVGLVEILQRIQNESPGLSLTTVAYGVDHNAEMLTNLARAGGGAYNVVKSLEDVATVFGDILGGLISVSAQKVEVQLPPDAEANTSYRTVKDPSGMTTIYVGDLYADAEVTVLFKSSPSKGPIRIKATDMTTLDLIDLVTEPQLLEDLSQTPEPLIMADYRQTTVRLLASIRGGQQIRSEIEQLIKQIQDDDRIRNHPLKPILLEDLEQALQLNQRGGHLSQMETVDMMQHSAYLGMSRGLRSITSNPPPRAHRIRRQNAQHTLNPDEDEEEDMVAPLTPPRGPMHFPPALSATTSPFANRMQTQFATLMRTMSSQQDPEPNSQSSQ